MIGVETVNGHRSWAGPDFDIVPYEAAHLRALSLQPMQADLGTLIAGSDLADKVAASGPAWTVLDHGRPIACCGFQFPWPGRAIAWAALGDCGDRMVRITRACKEKFAACPAERLECHVKADFRPGMRWVGLLGFKREALMPRFYGGEDFWCYVILRGRGQ